MCLPRVQGERPDIQLTSMINRKDLTLDIRAKIAREAFGGAYDAAEGEFVWTGHDRTRMKGKCLAVTELIGNPAGGGNWAAETITCEAPENQFEMAKALLIYLRAGFQLDPNWHRAETKGEKDRLRIIMQTNQELFEKVQEVMDYRYQVQAEAHRKWEQYIGFDPFPAMYGKDSGRQFIPNGSDSVKDATTGEIIHLTDLDGWNVYDMAQKFPGLGIRNL